MLEYHQANTDKSLTEEQKIIVTLEWSNSIMYKFARFSFRCAALPKCSSRIQSVLPIQKRTLRPGILSLATISKALERHLDETKRFNTKVPL